MNDNKTAEGLRDRLFDALDNVIAGKIKNEEVESICFVSEQIIKTARVELDMLKERNNHEQVVLDRRIELEEQKRASINMLSNVTEKIEIAEAICDED